MVSTFPLRRSFWFTPGQNVAAIHGCRTRAGAPRTSSARGATASWARLLGYGDRAAQPPSRSDEPTESEIPTAAR